MELKYDRIRLYLSAATELLYDDDTERMYIMDGAIYRYDDIPQSAWLIIKGGDYAFLDQITDVMPYRIVPSLPRKILDRMVLPVPSVVMWKVRSSNIKYVGYDSTAQKLYVMFDDGSVYEYTGVEPEIWNGLKGADSKGSFLHWFVKANGYPYRRIGGFLLDYSTSYLTPNAGSVHANGYLTGF